VIGIGESYPEYRPSGVPWLGDVPAHWSICRNKLILREVDERSKDGSEELLSVSQYTGVTPRRDRKEVGGLLTNAATLAGYKRVKPGDLVINIMLAWNGSLGVSPVEGIVSTAYCVFRGKAGVEPRFLHYLLRTPLLTGVFKAVSTGVVDSRLRLYPDAFLRLSTPLPPLAEQTAIVRFLDRSDHRIRRFIAAKGKLLALLNEQKQVIVHRAVTRGLDSAAPMKPSRVEWLGAIPAHWEVSQLRHLVSRGRRITYGIVQPGEPDPLGRYMVRGQDYSSGWADPATVFRVSNAIEAPYERSRLSTGDLVLTIVGSVGNVAVVPEWLHGANITQTTARVAIDPSKANAEFVAEVLRGPVGRHNVEFYVKGAAQPGLNLEHVKMFLIPVPPLAEQKMIVLTVQREVAPLDIALDRAKGEIALLREYRTRLISDVVTGRVDVREAAAALSDEDEWPAALEEGGAITADDQDTVDDLEDVLDVAEG
jgi:type I restriction enzyme S subunit